MFPSRTSLTCDIRTSSELQASRGVAFLQRSHIFRIISLRSMTLRALEGGMHALSFTGASGSAGIVES